jgi:hypothetical protein
MKLVMRQVRQNYQQEHGDADTAHIRLHADQFTEHIADEHADEHAE